MQLRGMGEPHLGGVNIHVPPPVMMALWLPKGERCLTDLTKEGAFDQL